MLFDNHTDTETDGLIYAGESAWGIHDVAEKFGITPRAIRFYEAKGLLSLSRQAGARIFVRTDIARLERILRAKRLGFTLDDIKVVLDVTDGKVTDRDELSTRRDNFKRVIQSLKRRRKDIETLVNEMGELCHVIDEHLENTEQDAGGLPLAAAYEEAFRQHLADDFAPDSSEMKTN